jgi:nucleoid-associated protein YgaU
MPSQADVAQALQSQGVEVFGLKVQEVGGMTEVRGTVRDQQAKTKAEQALAKVGRVTPHLEVQVPVAGTQAPSSQTYVVQAGDSLSKIAKRFYGDAAQWHRIHEANRDAIPNPDLIHPGQKLTIPSA